MFDLIANGHRSSASHGIVPLLTSWAIHAIVIGAVVVLPLLYATDRLPDAPSEVLAFAIAIGSVVCPDVKSCAPEIDVTIGISAVGLLPPVILSERRPPQPVKDCVLATLV